MPEQNGVAERANWSILDKGHTLLKDASAPDFLWADAFATAVYAINHTVSLSAGKVTPFEAFFHQKPDVYIHQLKDLGSRKLGEWGCHVKFIGYPHDSSGYRTYDPITHKVDVVQAPIFCEEACPRPSTTFESQVDILDGVDGEEDHGDVDDGGD